MLGRTLLASVALLCALATAQAQTWPTKPVRVIVPFTAGSAVDIVARAVMEQVSTQIGQPVIVENRGGAGGTLGVGMVAKADPDGHTILVHSTTHAVTATTYTNPGYDARKDFAAITALANVPNVLVTAPGKYKSVKDMIEAGRAKQGSLNYASAGAGSGAHLNAERLLMAAGIKAQHIPFKGGPEALTEIMAGRVDFYFVPLPPARGLIAGKKVDALAVSSATRAAALPERADHDRGRLSQFRIQFLDRHVPAGEDAGRDRRAAARGDDQGAEEPGRHRAARQGRRRADADVAGGRSTISCARRSRSTPCW